MTTPSPTKAATGACDRCDGARRVLDEEVGAYWPCPDCAPAASKSPVTTYGIEREIEDAHVSPLIVTRGDGIPLPDQKAAVAAFKRQCLKQPEPAETSRDAMAERCYENERDRSATLNGERVALEAELDGLRVTLDAVKAERDMYARLYKSQCERVDSERDAAQSRAEVAEAELAKQKAGPPVFEHVTHNLNRINYPEHYDDSAVRQFASAMIGKLDEKRAEGRGGWDDPDCCKVEHLANMLIEHIAKGDPVDIGNFAMMLFHREGGADALQKAAQALAAERLSRAEALAARLRYLDSVLCGIKGCVLLRGHTGFCNDALLSPEANAADATGSGGTAGSGSATGETK